MVGSAPPAGPEKEILRDADLRSFFADSVFLTMIRILQTSDLHLDAVFPELDGFAAARRADQMETFERIVECAIRQKVHLLVVAGDLFASPWPSDDVVATVQNGFQHLCDHGILPVVLPGGSDTSRCADGIFDRQVFEGTLVLDPHGPECVILDIEGQSLHLCSSRSMDGRITWPSESSAETADIRLGVLCRPPSTAEEGMSGWLDDAPWREWAFDYLICGGLHHYRQWHIDGSLVACCSGTPEGLAFGENGERYCVMASVGAEAVTVEKVPVNTRILKDEDIEVQGFSSREELVDRIRRLGHPDIMMRLTLTGQPAVLIHAPLVQRQAADAFYRLEIYDRIQFMNSPLAEEYTQGTSASGLLVRKAQELASHRSETERQVLDRALREVLVRCQSGVGESI
jgi:DNA repair exonuclease SbcCD nuclease subunit